MRSGRQLQERGRGVLEGLRGLGAGEDGDGLVEALELLRAQARALRQLPGLLLARVLGLGEEGLVGLELGLRVVLCRLAVGQTLALVSLIGRLLQQCALERRQFRTLRGHKLLEALLLLRLLHVGLLQVSREGIIHALQDALDLRGLRRVVAEGVARDLRGAERPGAAADEVLGALDEVLHHLQVLLAHGASEGCPVQEATDAGYGAEKLRLLERLEELGLAGSGACEYLDRGLQGAKALLELGLVLLVGQGLLVAHLRGLAL
mmetsp:Transcript_45352/g.140875  ORF Transcript_45352/g.140875 Transcript_45352/m.140875 type:complete len:263 (+) Transcript_45352:525-1313(+)